MVAVDRCARPRRAGVGWSGHVRWRFAMRRRTASAVPALSALRCTEHIRPNPPAPGGRAGRAGAAAGRSRTARWRWPRRCSTSRRGCSTTRADYGATRAPRRTASSLTVQATGMGGPSAAIVLRGADRAGRAAADPDRDLRRARRRRSSSATLLAAETRAARPTARARRSARTARSSRTPICWRGWWRPARGRRPWPPSDLFYDPREDARRRAGGARRRGRRDGGGDRLPGRRPPRCGGRVRARR